MDSVHGAGAYSCQDELRKKFEHKRMRAHLHPSMGQCEGGNLTRAFTPSFTMIEIQKTEAGECITLKIKLFRGSDVTNVLFGAVMVGQ